MSQEQREEIIRRAGGNTTAIKMASFGNIDDTLAKLNGSLGGDATFDAFGMQDFAKTAGAGPDELGRRLQEAASKQVNKYIEGVTQTIGDYTRALKEVGDYTSEQVTQFADSMSMRAAFMVDAKSIGGTRLSGRIADSISRMGLTAEEVQQSVGMNTEMYQRYGYVDPSAWSGHGVMTELNAYDFAIQQGTESRRTYGSFGNAQIGRFKALQKAQVDSSYAQNLIATAQRALTMSSDGDAADRAYVAGLIERSQNNMLTEEDYNAITTGSLKQKIASGTGQSVSTIESMTTDARANQETMLKHGTNQNNLGKFGQRRRLRGDARVNRRISGLLGSETGGRELRGEVVSSMMFAAELVGGKATEDEAFSLAAEDLKRRFADVLNDPNASESKKQQARNFLSKTEDEQSKMARGLIQGGYDAYDMNVNTFAQFGSDSYVDTEQHDAMARQGVRAQFSEIKGGMRVTGVDKLVKKFSEMHASGKEITSKDIGVLMAEALGADVDDKTSKQLQEALVNTGKFIDKQYKDPLNKLAKDLAGKDYDELTVDEKSALAKSNKEFRLRETALSAAYGELANLGETHSREMSEKNQEELAGRDPNASDTVNVENIVFNNANIVFEGGTLSGAKAVVRKPNSGGGTKTPDTRS